MDLRHLRSAWLALLLAACGGGGGGGGSDGAPAGNPTPDPTAPPAAAAPTPAPAGLRTGVQSKSDAARFLTQATFGPTLADIDALHADGSFDAWLQSQRALPPSLQLPYLHEQKAAGVTLNRDHRMEAWWRNAVTAPDQLRQRMAFALSEILVVSDDNPVLGIRPEGVAYYYDLLTQHALGNYRELLEAVTLSPAMAHYLSMFGNRRPDPSIGLRADENYARELMQLFTVGLVELNPDGTPRLGGDGKTLPTYSQADIENLARVFTGWSWVADSFWTNAPNWTAPLQPDERYHDSDAKTIIGGARIPAGLDPRAELELALDTLFAHDNLGPFLGSQLIQRLVTSNPSPAYVARVAAVFDDNGRGERGDLYAVARAILLDQEARDGHRSAPRTFGKLREPLLRVSALWRAFDARADDGRYTYTRPETALGQAPLRAQSVFNFFRPDYAPPGALAQAGLVAPELQIAADSTLNLTANALSYLSYWYRHEDGVSVTDPAYMRVDYRSWQTLAQNPDALLDRLSLVLMSGQMTPSMKQLLAEHLAPIAQRDPAQAVAETVMLIVTSPQFAVQR